MTRPPMIHRTSQDDAKLHPAGWVRLRDGWEVTALPLVDESINVDDVHVFARLTYADALRVAIREGAQLPSVEDIEALRDVGLELHPYLGTPIAEKTLEHSLRHDRDVARQLERADWDGCDPVAGAGKHWIAGAKDGSSRLMGWDKDGPGPSKAWWQPPQHAHNRLHHDDGTTTILVRRCPRDSDVYDTVPPPPSSDEPATDPSPETQPGPPVDVDVMMPPLVVTASPPKPEPPPMPLIKFVQAKSYARGRPYGEANVLTIHTAETAEALNVAENLQAWAARSAPVSWHFAIDGDSITQSVKLGDRAWAAGPGNDRGVHYEIGGRASQGPGGWADAYSDAAVRFLAQLLAEHSVRLGIPLVKLTPQDLLDGKPGVCGHSDWTKASQIAKVRKIRKRPWFDANRNRWRTTTHMDPGPHFPWDKVLTLAKALR